MSYFPRTSAEINATEMRQVVSSSVRLSKLKEEAKQALLSVSLNRKKLYDIIVDLKEHFEEYGFKSPAAAVEDVIPRSKRWANMFCAEIEAELEIGQVGNSFPTEPDKTELKEQKALSQVAEREKAEANQAPVECPRCFGTGWIGVKPKETVEQCKCGCGLSLEVCQRLFEHGVPSDGLTAGQAGLIMGKIKANNWRLPEAWKWVKNRGEWLERRWKK